MSKTTTMPDGLELHDPDWHYDKFVEFTDLKYQLGEPSPHLAIVGHMVRNSNIEDKLWLLGCYGATYCLPSAQVIWEHWSLDDVLAEPDEFNNWLVGNWAGIITRTERRCVRTPPKMFRCLSTYAKWARDDYPKLPKLQADSAKDYYDKVWKSLTDGVYSFGRYISIRVIEGLRRYCDVPAILYDVRSVGGWSPKRCMMYLHPEHIETLSIDNAAGNALMDELVEDLILDIKEELPYVDSYRIAAMLCEYKGAFEKRHQYPGWTLDQEPLLYDKTVHYWGDDINKDMLWDARKAVFPWQVLGEIGSRWYGTRWDLAACLRDHDYNWSDIKWDYDATEDLANPVVWTDERKTQWVESHSMK